MRSAAARARSCRASLLAAALAAAALVRVPSPQADSRLRQIGFSIAEDGDSHDAADPDLGGDRALEVTCA